MGEHGAVGVIDNASLRRYLGVTELILLRLALIFLAVNGLYLEKIRYAEQEGED